MYIVTVNEMRELEARAEKEYGLSSSTLMEHAGHSAAEILAKRISQERSPEGAEMLLLIGPGNNGGDGLVMANHLEQWGISINLYTWKNKRLVINGREIPEEATATELTSAIQRADYIVDALLGTGRSRPLTDEMRTLLAQVGAERKKRESLKLVAVDLPTGLNADTGEVDPGAIPVDLTITLACPKQGFFFFPGREYLGELFVGDIGLPEEMEIPLRQEMLTARLVRSRMPDRPLQSNKGTFGKVMLLCGSLPYPGSAFLAGSAALRTGAGLLTMAVTEQLLPIYASALHESTFVILPPESDGSLECVRALKDHLTGYKSLLVGPGLGQSPYTREVILQL